MMNTMSQRERRVVALGVLLSALILLTLGVVMPYVARYDHYLTAIDDQQFRLSRLQAAAMQLPALDREIGALRSRIHDRGDLIQQETPSLAAAWMQEQVSAMVARSGGEIRSMQVGRFTEERGFTRVAVGVRMAATSDEVAELFADIETRRPLMFIDNINVRLVRHRRARNELETGQVELDFEVFGYLWAGRT